MDTTTNSCPEVRVMMGSVVSIVVAPPAEMGARRPNQRTNSGAASRVMISRLMLASRAMEMPSVPYPKSGITMLSTSEFFKSLLKACNQKIENEEKFVNDSLWHNLQKIVNAFPENILCKQE